MIQMESELAAASEELKMRKQQADDGKFKSIR